MKKFITSILMAACVQVVAAATVAEETADGKYIIKNGEVTMTIDGNGGKILSYKYGDAEVISQTTFPNSFGSTFWTSPQKEWNWPPVPEFDRQPYTVENGDKFVMTSQLSERLKYRVSKTFVPNKKDQSIAITYTIKNESDETRKVAPWEITRVPNDGIIFFDAPVDAITPAGLMNFQAANGLSWFQADEAQQNRKINADGKGWLAYLNDGLLLVKKFEDLSADAPAPGEAEIQVYVNRGKTYIELESQGAYVTLAPGERLTWTVKWMLAPYSGEVPSAKAVKAVKKMLKK